MESVWKKIVALKPDYNILPLEEVYASKMNNIYLNICCYNLYEKFLCGGISFKEWMKISSYCSLPL